MSKNDSPTDEDAQNDHPLLELAPNRQEKLINAYERFEQSDAAEDPKVNRRGVLAGIATLLTGSAIGGGAYALSTEEVAAATAAVGQVGEPGSTVDVYGDAVTANSVDTDDYRTGNGSKAQFRADDYFVPVASGVGVVDRIDPEATTNPFADGVQALIDAGASSKPSGQLLLPPGTHTEASTFDKDIAELSVIGPGRNACTIEFTDLSADGMQISGSGGVSKGIWTGFTIDGSDETNRTAGSGLRFTNARNSAAWGFDIGHLTLANWGGTDPICFFDTGHAFSSHWRNIQLEGEGEAWRIENAGAPMSVGEIYSQTRTQDTALVIGSAGAKISIDTLNIGGESNRAIDQGDTVGGSLDVGTLNFEPYVNPGTGSFGIVTRGPCQMKVDMVHINDAGISGTMDLDSVFVITGTAPEHKRVGAIRNDATLADNVIKVDSNIGSLTCRYDGPAGDLINRSGTSPLSNEIECIGSNFSG